MTRITRLSVLAGCCCAPSALAVNPTVQFRIVERTNQAVANTSDAVLDLAILAMVPNSHLGVFSLDMAIAGEAENRGSLARELITRTDGTYETGFGINSQIGRGGVARQYTWLASLNGIFNGQINNSAGTFTNTPDQEIGTIGGYAAGQGLLGVPGLDADQDGNPDTWSGNGSGDTPPDQTHTLVDPAIAGPYLGDNQFHDIYHFRYTVTNFTLRTLHFELRSLKAGIFSDFVYEGGLWGELNSAFADTPVAMTPLDISVTPAPAAAIPIALAAWSLRRRRTL